MEGVRKSHSAENSSAGLKITYILIPCYIYKVLSYKMSNEEATNCGLFALKLDLAPVVCRIFSIRVDNQLMNLADILFV